MPKKEYVAAAFIAAALIAVGVGIRETGKPLDTSATTDARPDSSRRRAITANSLSLEMAEQLVHLPTSIDERALAQEALRLGDEDMDLAFASAVRRLTNRVRANTPEAVDADARLRQSLQALAKDQGDVDSLTAKLKSAPAGDAPALTDRLNLARAQAALDQDAVDDARQDLRRAGGDPQGEMQQLIEEHEATSKGADSLHVTVAELPESHGLVRLAKSWQTYDEKLGLVRRAGQVSDSLAERYETLHDSVDARGARNAQLLTDSLALAKSLHDSTKLLLSQTQQRAYREKSRMGLDQRVDVQHALVQNYRNWEGVIAQEKREVLNDALQHIAVILVMLLVATLLAAWVERSLGGLHEDRRKRQTRYMVSKVSLQVTTVLLILLVVFGPPDNLGTFLGLAGAGLTVALKDFLVAVVGWFVLMGRNGIRIGDLVEINGVTGEVVELGLFYTVLLETGTWTESGHPTGRRVTFTNGFAVEGHYFNFSTSGRWLLDEVHITVPTGQDPNVIAEALRREVESAIAERVSDSSAGWSEVQRIPRFVPTAGKASVNLKPTAGGVDVTVRYLTRVSDREELRGRLYRIAIDLLGGRADGSRPGAVAAHA